MRIVAAVSLITLVGLAACGGDDGSGEEPSTSAAPTTTAVATTTPGEVAIVDVIEGFEYYNPCQNSTIDIGGTTYYSVPDGSMAELGGDYPAIDETRYPWPAEPQGLVRIAPPGPGDDVGTMVVYADGTARFESDSGMVSWFTDQELTYNWVC
jgi:hypothetical protein